MLYGGVQDPVHVGLCEVCMGRRVRWWYKGEPVGVRRRGRVSDVAATRKTDGVQLLLSWTSAPIPRRLRARQPIGGAKPSWYASQPDLGLAIGRVKAVVQRIDPERAHLPADVAVELVLELALATDQEYVSAARACRHTPTRTPRLAHATTAYFLAQSTLAPGRRLQRHTKTGC